jgi:hypothetical protein
MMAAEHCRGMLEGAAERLPDVAEPGLSSIAEAWLPSIAEAWYFLDIYAPLSGR